MSVDYVYRDIRLRFSVKFYLNDRTSYPHFALGSIFLQGTAYALVQVISSSNAFSTEQCMSLKMFTILCETAYLSMHYLKNKNYYNYNVILSLATECSASRTSEKSTTVALAEVGCSCSSGRLIRRPDVLTGIIVCHPTGFSTPPVNRLYRVCVWKPIMTLSQPQ